MITKPLTNKKLRELIRYINNLDFHLFEMRLKQLLIFIDQQSIDKLIEECCKINNLQLLALIYNETDVSIGHFLDISLEFVGKYEKYGKYENINDTNTNILNYLINLSTENDVPIAWFYGLWGAIDGGQLDMVKFFCQKLKENNMETDYERNIEIATEKGHFDIVNYLTEKHIKQKLNVSLEKYASSGDLEMVKECVRQGADDITFAKQVSYLDGQKEVYKYLSMLEILEM